jgi:hypothetical protein
MKFLMYLVFFIAGLAVGVSTTESTWKEKMKFALEEREEVHKIMIDVENTVTKKEAFDEFLQTLWDTCINDGGGGFFIDNLELKKRQQFKCSREEDNEFTVARR